MTGEGVPVTIKILDKEYMVSCQEDEKDGLLESAKLLNDRLREVRDGGKIIGAERMAVMTALNVIHEFYQKKQERESLADDLCGEVRRLEDKVRIAIGRRSPIQALD